MKRFSHDWRKRTEGYTFDRYRETRWIAGGLRPHPVLLLSSTLRDPLDEIGAHENTE